VRKHQGRIWFETEMGKGTTFFIHLPIGESQAEEKK
jgi:signal transduction histidine kinase